MYNKSFQDKNVIHMNLNNVEKVLAVPLPFNVEKLVGISEKLITSHWENNYCSAVDALNDVNNQLQEMFTSKNTSAFLLNGLKREQLIRTGSVVNHNLYFENLGGKGEIHGEILKYISVCFKSAEDWEEQFRQTAACLAGGSGWVILGYNYQLRNLENYWCYDHMHAPMATIPLLVMDMYEHSYQLDYGANASSYIDAFFKNINWEVVNKRVKKIDQLL